MEMAVQSNSLADDAPAALAAFPARVATVSGRSLAYREAGAHEQPAILLLHGIGSASGSWLHQLGALSDRFRLVAWDAPGYGGSDPLAADAPTAADYAGAAVGLLDALGIQRSLVVGHSLGALTAAALAAGRPERVVGLVLADPARGYGDAEPDEREKRLRQRLDRMDRLGPAGLAAERSANLLSPNPPPEALDLVRWNMGRLNPHGHAQAARLLAGGVLLRDLNRWDGPLLVLWGSEDTITPPEACASVAAARPQARTAEIPAAGHASYVERPEAFNDILRAFAESLS